MKLYSIVALVIILPYVACERKCLGVFTGDQQVPLGENVQCFNVNSEPGSEQKRYCVEISCPKPECSDPFTPDKGCPFCPGTCVVGDKIIQAGTSTTCADGCNTCTCGTNEDGATYFSMTRMGCFFGGPPPECEHLA